MTSATYEMMNAVVTQGVSRAHLRIGMSASTPTGRSGPQRIPASIPRAQVYYWTRAWQEGEQESLANLQAGNARRFPSGRDAIRWLLSEDD